MQVLACIEELYRCRTLADFPACAFAAFGKLLPFTVAAFNEVNLPRNRIVAVTDRPLVGSQPNAAPGETVPFPAPLASIWERHSAQHPLVRYVAETGDGQALKISDFLSLREYHGLDLYREFYGPLRVEDQMCLTIRSDRGFLIALAFNRARRDFSETDRVKLNLVRPHLLQAYANAEDLAGRLEEQADLVTALRETGHGLIALNAAGKVTHATPGAFDRLACYFPGARPARGLPRAIVAWLRQGAADPLIVPTAASRLIVRRPHGSERPLLLLSEENAGSPSGRDRVTDRAGLTSREFEVLRWLAEGRTNPEIGLILGVASGTVKMHVEHILAKLGAGNRTEASVLARDAGLLPPRS